MKCKYCGAANLDAARCCERCSKLFIPTGSELRGLSAPMPMPIQSAQDHGIPPPKSKRIAEGTLKPLRPGILLCPIEVVQSAVDVSRPTPARAASGQTVLGNAYRTSMVQVFGWVGGGLFVCLGLVLGSQQAVLRLPPRLSEWALPNLENPIEPPPVQSSEPPVTPPRPEVGPVLSARELADAINAELRRSGFDWAIVRVAEDGTATVSGSAPSANTHDELLLWLQSVSGVERIVDEIKIHLSSASHAQQKPRPRAETLPVSDATSISRVVQRELALLGLDNVTVEVAKSGEVTLRGTADDAAIKAKAIAAARAATPGGRVRDLVFVVEK